MQETWLPSLDWEDPRPPPPKEDMATHAWNFSSGKFPWTEEPGRLQPIGSQRIKTWLNNTAQHKSPSCTLNIQNLYNIFIQHLCCIFTLPSAPNSHIKIRCVSLSLGITDICTISNLPTYLSIWFIFPSCLLFLHVFYILQATVCLCVSPSVVSNSLWFNGLYPSRLLYPWDSPGKNTGVGSHFLLQLNLSNPDTEPGSLALKQIIYHLSHQVSPNYYINFC